MLYYSVYIVYLQLNSYNDNHQNDILLRRLMSGILIHNTIKHDAYIVL